MSMDPAGLPPRGWLSAAAVIASTCLATAGLAWAASVAEPDGYRHTDFRADVPATLKGAKVVSTVEATTIWRAGDTVFIDVMPRPPKPPNLPEGTVWRDMQRDSIPAGHWLPNVGFGRLATAVDAYFRTHLRALTAGNRGKALLFYCLERCWMSWNAAKRALEYGYTNVIWYPAGTDGWAEAGHPLEKTKPPE